MNKLIQFLLTVPQSLVSRLKENLEKMTEERNQRIAAENREKDQNKRMQRQIRDMKEEMGELSKKEAEASRKKHELVRTLALDDLMGLISVHINQGSHVSSVSSILSPGNGHRELRGSKSEPTSGSEAGFQEDWRPAGCHRR